ncbi:MAG: DUF4389 domain-containing protein [Gammaproteobacteria bacterium]|nr:DUF4389 domain-containing protein [Gammaproteobacteria bacterium]
MMLDETESTRPREARRATWMRLLFVLLFALFYMVAEVVALVVVAVQFGCVLIGGARNPNLLAFSANLSEYMYRILRFVMFNSEQKPFPFADWPAAEGDAWDDDAHPGDPA